MQNHDNWTMNPRAFRTAHITGEIMAISRAKSWQYHGRNHGNITGEIMKISRRNHGNITGEIMEISRQ
jgi:hypothetical protein